MGSSLPWNPWTHFLTTLRELAKVATNPLASYWGFGFVGKLKKSSHTPPHYPSSWGQWQDFCRNPTLRQVWGWNSHSQKSGNLESSETPENSERDFRGQNTLPWDILYIIGKVLKCRCRKWACMYHSNICSTSYGRKKGRESNWQFDSRPLKVKNRPDPGVFRWSATHRWKALEESYKFSLDLVPIGGLSWELWALKVPRV
jgi:hypothetical protein